MKTLVTGAAGFLGRHFSAELESRGHGVDRCDITAGWDCLDSFADKRYQPVYDLVVHAAAVSPHRIGIDTVDSHHAANAHLDAAMFEWAARTSQGRVLYLSSCAVYPASLQYGGQPFSEAAVDLNRPEPVDGYAWVKLTGERLALEARRAGVAVTVVRPFSGYGEDQSLLFPFRALVERARRGDDPFVIWGDGTQIRDWVHVDDLVRGALALVDVDIDEPVNLCTGRGVSMMDVARYACLEAGYPTLPTWDLRADQPAGSPYRVGDPSRMSEYYTSEITIEQGVKRALAGG